MKSTSISTVYLNKELRYIFKQCYNYLSNELVKITKRYYNYLFIKYEDDNIICCSPSHLFTSKFSDLNYTNIIFDSDIIHEFTFLAVYDSNLIINKIFKNRLSDDEFLEKSLEEIFPEYINEINILKMEEALV